jgi:hypothetical protein
VSSAPRIRLVPRATLFAKGRLAPARSRLCAVEAPNRRWRHLASGDVASSVGIISTPLRTEDELASCDDNPQRTSTQTRGEPSQHSPKQSRRNESVSGNIVARLDRICDWRRDCLLNELYYGHRLNLFSRTNLWLDAVIVIGSGASGVSRWVIWTTYPELKVIWAVIAAAATLRTA